MTRDELTKALIIAATAEVGYLRRGDTGIMRPTSFRGVLSIAIILAFDGRVFTCEQFGALAGCEVDISMRALREWERRGVVILDSFRVVRPDGWCGAKMFTVRIDMAALSKLPMIEIPERYTDLYVDPRGMSLGVSSPEIRKLRDEIEVRGKFDPSRLTDKTPLGRKERWRLIKFIRRLYPGVCATTIGAAFGATRSQMDNAARQKWTRKANAALMATTERSEA